MTVDALSFIDPEIRTRLAANGVKTIEALATMSVAALVEKTGARANVALELLNKVRAPLAAKPIQNISKPRQILGVSAMAPGALTELFGVSGAGKTQIAFSIAARGDFASVFWLDTEGTYRSERVAQMTDSSDCLESLRVRQVRDEEGLFQSLAMIKQMLQALPPQAASNTLVVVDSITAAIKTADNKKKAEVLHNVAQTLKALGCCVLVTNQVRAEIKTHAFAPGPDFHAALGSTWAAAITVRLQVHREGARRTLKVVKTPETGVTGFVVPFSVSTEGVAVLE